MRLKVEIQVRLDFFNALLNQKYVLFLACAIVSDIVSAHHHMVSRWIFIIIYNSTNPFKPREK